MKPELSEPGTTLFLRIYNKSMRVPFVVYADFESFIKPIDTCQPDSSTSYTKQYQKHTNSSFCYCIKCFDDSVYKYEPVAFRADSENDDVAGTFIAHIKDIYKQFKSPKRMIFTNSHQKIFDEATVYHICEKELGDDGVRDHCHLSGKFRRAAHAECNLNYKVPKFFPVVFRNLSGYDSHLFIKNWLVTMERGLIVFQITNKSTLASQEKKWFTSL